MNAWLRFSLSDCDTPYYGLTLIEEYKDRDGRQALPFAPKRFIEWLPRLGEFIEIG